MQNFTKVNNYEALQHSAALNVLIEAQSLLGLRKGVEWIVKKAHEPYLVEASLNKGTVAQEYDSAALHERARVTQAKIKKKNKFETTEAEKKMKEEAEARAIASTAEEAKHCIVKTPHVAKMTAEENEMLKRAHVRDLDTAKIRAIQKLAIQDEKLAIEKQPTAPIFPSAPDWHYTETELPPNYTEIGYSVVLERAKAPELPAYTELSKPGYGNREVERMLEVCRKMSNLGIMDIQMSLEWQTEVKVLTNNLVKAKRKLPSNNEIIQQYYQQLKKKLKEFEIESHKLSKFGGRFNTTKWATYWNDFIKSEGLDLTDIREIQ